MLNFKKHLFIGGLLFFVVQAFTQEIAPKCGADKINIEEIREKVKKNGIKQKIKLENLVRGGAMSMNKTKTEVITYDKQGRIVEWAYYTNNSSVEAIYRYSYDSRGNISEWTLFSPIGDVIEKTIYSYNNAGYLTQETFFEAGNRFVSRSVYETDASTKSIIETEYAVNNTPTAKRIYYYSDLAKGQIIKKEVYKQENQLYYTVISTYNENRTLQQEDFLSSSGNLAYQFIYQYDVKGNNTEKIKYSPTRVVLQKITKVFTWGGLEKGINEYDRQGRIVSSVEYNYTNF